MALPPKSKTKNPQQEPKQANAVSTNQVHGAIKAFVDKKKQMSSKTKKRVATRLKAMKAGAK
jgi:hypothetical protein